MLRMANRKCGMEVHHSTSLWEKKKRFQLFFSWNCLTYGNFRRGEIAIHFQLGKLHKSRHVRALTLRTLTEASIWNSNLFKIIQNLWSKSKVQTFPAILLLIIIMAKLSRPKTLHGSSTLDPESFKIIIFFHSFSSNRKPSTKGKRPIKKVSQWKSNRRLTFAEFNTSSRMSHLIRCPT